MRSSGHPFVVFCGQRSIAINCNGRYGFLILHEEGLMNSDLAGIGTDRHGRCGLGLNENDAERGNDIAVADSVTLQRLRREES
jgi:hypothetical protein